MHLDAAQLAVVESAMPERSEVEIGAQLAVDAREQVEVELRRHPARVVVGGMQARRVLLEVDADQQAAARAGHGAGVLQEGGRLERREIADGGAWKVDDASLRAET